MPNQIISFRLNGEVIEMTVSPSEMLLDVLREKMHLTGTKRGCGKGECGACTVIFNGKAMNACLIPAMRAQVDFSADLTTKKGGGSASEILAVSAIVYTLTEFPGVERVQIMIEGKKVATLYGHMDLSEPLGRIAGMLQE